MKYSKKDKEAFIKRMKDRTKQHAIDIINFCNDLPRSEGGRVIIYQLIKAATSTGANYRAACRGRSKAEFFSKLSITIEEADESQYWLEMIRGTKIKCDDRELDRLLKEIGEILAILTTARYRFKERESK